MPQVSTFLCVLAAASCRNRSGSSAGSSTSRRPCALRETPAAAWCTTGFRPRSTDGVEAAAVLLGPQRSTLLTDLSWWEDNCTTVRVRGKSQANGWSRKMSAGFKPPRRQLRVFSLGTAEMRSYHWRPAEVRRKTIVQLCERGLMISGSKRDYLQLRGSYCAYAGRGSHTGGKVRANPSRVTKRTVGGTQ